MKIGTLVLKTNDKAQCPLDCIEADGSWHTKEQYPELYEIFKDCKCLKPKAETLTGIVDSEPMVKGIFHLPNSYGKSWIIYKEGV